MVKVLSLKVFFILFVKLSSYVKIGSTDVLTISIQFNKHCHLPLQAKSVFPNIANATN